MGNGETRRSRSTCHEHVHTRDVDLQRTHIKGYLQVALEKRAKECPLKWYRNVHERLETILEGLHAQENEKRENQ